MNAVELMVSSKRSLRGGVILAALVLIGNVPAYSQSSSAADVLGRAFDVSKGDGTIRVGKKGKAQREFAVQLSKAPGALGLTLREHGGKAHSASFSYEEKQGSVDVGLGASKAKIDIHPGGKVAVGQKECGRNDAACVAGAVASALPDLESEEVAAAVAALEDDLVGMQHGPLILDAMRHLAQQLVGAG